MRTTESALALQPVTRNVLKTSPLDGNSECSTHPTVALAVSTMRAQVSTTVHSSAVGTFSMPGERIRWGARESGDRRSMFRGGRSLQQSDVNDTPVEVYVSVNSTLKNQRCRSICFWKLVSLHPISKIKVYLRPHPLPSIRKHARYYPLSF